MKYEILTEKLMEHFTSPQYTEEVSEARRDFFDRAGFFDELSADFEMKTAQFMDWYLFVRRLARNDMRPIDVAMEKSEYPISDELLPYYKNLQNSRHSLFEFLKLKSEDVYIRDIFSNYRYVIRKSPFTLGFSKDELFEARLIPHEESFVFSRSFCLHPPQVTRFIFKEVKKINKLKEEETARAREALIVRLFKMRYKHEQYKHVDLKDIYSNESRLGL